MSCDAWCSPMVLVVESAISKGLSEFLERGLIRDNDREAYDSILAWASRKCSSGSSEMVIAVLSMIPFIFARGAHWAERLTGLWVLVPSGKSLSLAGFWTFFVSAFSTLASEKLVIIAFIVGATVFFLLPLLTLAGTLHRTRRKGLLEYGAFVSRYDQQFDRKWAQRRNPEGEPLLGTPDIPSLANLGISFQTVHEMRFLPIDRRSIMILTVSAALPMLPFAFLDPWAMEIAEKLVSRLL
jgi:hypothetical protein